MAIPQSTILGGKYRFASTPATAGSLPRAKVVYQGFVPDGIEPIKRNAADVEVVETGG